MPTERKPRRWILGIAALAIAAVVAVAVLADLGPFEDDEPSEGDFVAQGDAICEDAHEQFAELQQDPPQTASEAAVLTEKLIAISTTELDQIRALDAPAELQPALDRYLEAREEGIAALQDGLEAAREEDAQGYAAAQAEVTSGQVKRLRLAQEVGFEECSRPLGGAAISE